MFLRGKQFSWQTPLFTAWWKRVSRQHHCIILAMTGYGYFPAIFYVFYLWFASSSDQEVRQNHWRSTFGSAPVFLYFFRMQNTDIRALWKFSSLKASSEVIESWTHLKTRPRINDSFFRKQFQKITLVIYRMIQKNRDDGKSTIMKIIIEITQGIFLAIDQLIDW